MCTTTKCFIPTDVDVRCVYPMFTMLKCFDLSGVCPVYIWCMRTMLKCFDPSGVGVRCTARQDEALLVIKQAFCEMPNFHRLCDVLTTHPLADVEQHIGIAAGIPVQPMLAKPTTGIEEVRVRCGGPWPPPSNAVL